MRFQNEKSNKSKIAHKHSWLIQNHFLLRQYVICDNKWSSREEIYCTTFNYQGGLNKINSVILGIWKAKKKLNEWLLRHFMPSFLRIIEVKGRLCQFIHLIYSVSQCRVVLFSMLSDPSSCLSKEPLCIPKSIISAVVLSKLGAFMNCLNLFTLFLIPPWFCCFDRSKDLQ